jgi:hypothetical protein
MRILRLLQRNHDIREKGTGPYISYYPYQISILVNFELMTREEVSLSGIEPAFQRKVAEAVQILSNSGYIVQDPSQRNSDFQIPRICTRWMSIRGFAISLTVPPLPSFSERDAPSVRRRLGILSAICARLLWVGVEIEASGQVSVCGARLSARAFRTFASPSASSSRS